MGRATLSATRFVLDYTPLASGRKLIHFNRKPDDSSDVPNVVLLNRTDWEDLGCPTKISVKVIAGSDLDALDA